jgi:hypothetical protein
MTIQLKVNSKLERRLQQAANQSGLTPDTYIMRLLQKDLEGQSAASRLSPTESKLLQKINTSLSAIEWERYQRLLAKRNAESLSKAEQSELIALSDQIEAANVRRMKAVAELARLRRTSVAALVETLGLSPLHD